MYRASTGHDYFADLYTSHRDLGLGIEHRGVRVLANLVPIKEKEIVLLGERFDENLAGAIYTALHCLTSTLNMTCFNLVIYHPPLDPGADGSTWQDFPVVVRMVDRGDPMNRTADFGAMELYAASVISSDPFKVAQKLFRCFGANTEHGTRNAEFGRE